MPERLLAIAKELRQLLSTHSPDHVAVEELFFYNNVTTAITVAQARGVLLQVVAEAGIPVHGYTPPQVKQAVTSHGQADKQQMQKMIMLILGLTTKPSPDDAADALAIAVTCAHSVNFKTIGI
jgi:crossover junction endodeoxyribonuclease RuvC